MIEPRQHEVEVRSHAFPIPGSTRSRVEYSWHWIVDRKELARSHDYFRTSDAAMEGFETFAAAVRGAAVINKQERKEP